MFIKVKFDQSLYFIKILFGIVEKFGCQNFYPTFSILIYNLGCVTHIKNFLLSMTVEKARKLLGKDGDGFSDEQILTIINSSRVLALGCIRKIESKMATDGLSFFKDKTYLGGGICPEQ